MTRADGWSDDLNEMYKQTLPFLMCEDRGQDAPVYIGRIANCAAPKCDVLLRDQLLYLSYTDTRDKNLFRNGAFIKCDLKIAYWMPMPKPVSTVFTEPRSKTY
jgi:hypothetical protein